MANRNRTDPHRSAQQQIFRGSDESRGHQLNAEGGKRGSDLGNMQPHKEEEDDREVEPPHKAGQRKGVDSKP